MWYLFTASAFSFGMFFSWLAYSTAKSPERKALAKVLFIVDMMSFFTYSLSALRWTPSLRDGNGYPVDMSRYLEWICTCPSLIMLIGNITKKPTVGNRTKNFDYALLVFGFLAAITKEPFSSYFSFGALCCFSQVLLGLDSMYQSAIAGENGCNLDALSLQSARLMTLLTWSACR